MAEFCRACMDEFGDGLKYNDAKGFTSKKAWKLGKAALFFCEGCGCIQVDPDGNCVSPDCLKAGEPGHGMPWYGEGEEL